MDRAGDELLARTGFPGDEHGRIDRCNLGDAREHFSQGRGRTDDALEHAFLAELVADGKALLAILAKSFENPGARRFRWSESGATTLDHTNPYPMVDPV